MGWGIASCAHWLQWKCGIGLVAAREKVRVAKALPALPKLADAMRRGVISYCKVRALTRIATPDNEALLLRIAEDGTVSHVEKTVRLYRRVGRLEELDQANELHVERGLRCYWDESGALVVEGRLPPEQGALVMKALQAASDALRQAERASPEAPAGGDGTSGQAEHASREAPAGGGGTSGQAEHASCEASAPAGAAASGSGASGQAERASCESSAPPEAPPPDEPKQPYPARQADALGLLCESFLGGGGGAPLAAGDRHLVTVHVDEAVLRDELQDGRSHLDGGPSLPPATVRRLCCDGGLVPIVEREDGTPLDVGRKTRVIPPAMRRALDARDGGCRFPGCTNSRFVDAHHIHHWADGGETKLDNLVLLCRRHHRFVHEHGFRIEGTAAAGVRFIRPDGMPVPHVPPSPGVEASEGCRGLRAAHTQLGLDIGPRTGVTRWYGERMDYNAGVGALLERRR